MKGYDNDTTKTHPNRDRWGDRMCPAGFVSPRPSQDKRPGSRFARNRTGHLDRPQRRTTSTVRSPAQARDSPCSSATTVRTCMGALSKSCGRSAPGGRTRHRAAAAHRARANNNHRVDHQLQRIDDVHPVDPRRFLVQGAPRRILHEHTDQRATQDRLRLLRQPSQSHPARGSDLATEAIFLQDRLVPYRLEANGPQRVAPVSGFAGGHGQLAWSSGRAA